MNIDTFDLGFGGVEPVHLPEELIKPKAAIHHVPAGQSVAQGRYLIMTEDEVASFKAPDITDSERARRLCQIVENHLNAEKKAANWDNVRELRVVFNEARRKYRVIAKHEGKAHAKAARAARTV